MSKEYFTVDYVREMVRECRLDKVHGEGGIRALKHDLEQIANRVAPRLVLRLNPGKRGRPPAAWSVFYDCSGVLRQIYVRYSGRVDRYSEYNGIYVGAYVDFVKMWLAGLGIKRADATIGDIIAETLVPKRFESLPEE